MDTLERRPHSYRVGYYEQGHPPGLDATIYSPTVDFKFKNFRVTCKRSNKKFPMKSMEIARQVGGYLHNHCDKKVEQEKNVS